MRKITFTEAVEICKGNPYAKKRLVAQGADGQYYDIRTMGTGEAKRFIEKISSPSQ